MAKKEEFKEFVKNNPHLLKYVKTNEMSWQKFYEMYDLYGEDEKIWSEYKNNQTKIEEEAKIAGMSDMLAWLKMIDLDSLQEGVSSLQRVLGVFQDLSGNKTATNTKEEYKPRPLYRHFED